MPVPRVCLATWNVLLTEPVIDVELQDNPEKASVPKVPQA